MNTKTIARRAATTIGLAATAGFLSIAPSYAQLPVPNDPVSAVVTGSGSDGSVDTGLETLQIGLGALGGIAVTAAVAGAVGRSHRRHAAMPA